MLKFINFFKVSFEAEVTKKTEIRVTVIGERSYHRDRSSRSSALKSQITFRRERRKINSTYCTTKFFLPVKTVSVHILFHPLIQHLK